MVSALTDGLIAALYSAILLLISPLNMYVAAARHIALTLRPSAVLSHVTQHTRACILCLLAILLPGLIEAATYMASAVSYIVFGSTPVSNSLLTPAFCHAIY